MNTNFPETKLLKMVRSVSEDKVYNTIEFNEFLQMMAKQQQGEINEEALMDAFRQDLLSLIWQDYFTMISASLTKTKMVS